MERIYVVDAIYDDFVSALVRRTDSLNLKGASAGAPTWDR